MFNYICQYFLINFFIISCSSFVHVYNQRYARLIKQYYLHLIYFRELDMSINEKYFQNELKNFTDSHRINLKITILNQTVNSLMLTKFCSKLSVEQRDTILIADLYTKEIDLLSRSLRIPTIAMFNRYSIVQGKLVGQISIEFSSSASILFSIIRIYSNLWLIQLNEHNRRPMRLKPVLFTLE